MHSAVWPYAVHTRLFKQRLVAGTQQCLNSYRVTWLIPGRKNSKEHWSGFVPWLQMAFTFFTYFTAFLLVKCILAYIWPPCCLVWLLYFHCKDSFSGQGSCSGRHLSVQCICTLNFEESSAKVNQGEIRKEDRLCPHRTLWMTLSLSPTKINVNTWTVTALAVGFS